jgi:hypothetical protein
LRRCLAVCLRAVEMTCEATSSRLVCPAFKWRAHAPRARESSAAAPRATASIRASVATRPGMEALATCRAGLARVRVARADVLRGCAAAWESAWMSRRAPSTAALARRLAKTNKSVSTEPALVRAPPKRPAVARRVRFWRPAPSTVELAAPVARGTRFVRPVFATVRPASIAALAPASIFPRATPTVAIVQRLVRLHRRACSVAAGN